MSVKHNYFIYNYLELFFVTSSIALIMQNTRTINVTTINNNGSTLLL